MTDLALPCQVGSAHAFPLPDQPFVVDEGMSLTLRTAVFRLGTDGPAYAHLDLEAGRRALCLQLYDSADAPLRHGLATHGRRHQRPLGRARR